MKKLTMVLMAVLLAASVFAQSPQKMSYQSVIRNSSGSLITNSPVGMRIQILEGSEFGAAIYVETHAPTTNSNGLATIEIGTGSVVFGIFSTINWASNSYFLKTETDPLGGTSYTITGTSQLLSVPYALYAETAGNGGQTYIAGNGIDITGSTITNTLPNQNVSIAGTGGTNVTGTYPSFTVNSLRIIAGTTTGGFAPTNVTGTGYTVTRLNDGWYTVDFAIPFSVVPSATVSIYHSGTGSIFKYSAIITSISTTSMTVKTGFGDTGDTPVNTEGFSFVVVGN